MSKKPYSILKKTMITITIIVLISVFGFIGLIMIGEIYIPIFQNEELLLCCAIPPTYLETAGISEESFPEIEGFESVTIQEKNTETDIGKLIIPVRWEFEQNVISDEVTGLFQTYHMEIRGPDGQILRRINQIFYTPENGGSFDEAWRRILHKEAGRKMSNIKIDTLQFCEKQYWEPLFEMKIRYYTLNDFILEPWKAAFYGTVNGENWSGWAYIQHSSYPTKENKGMIEFRITYGPEEMHEQLDQLDTFLAHNFWKYSRYVRYSNQIKYMANKFAIDELWY